MRHCGEGKNNKSIREERFLAGGPEGVPFSELEACPACFQPASYFEKIDEPASSDGSAPADTAEKNSPAAGLPLAYPEKYARHDGSIPHMDEIHEMAVRGESISAAMATTLKVPGFDEILILGAGLDPMPLESGAPVDTAAVIGPKAAKPMILENPVYVSHMSFGALSKETKIALSKGSAMAHSATCSGEGGILPEEMRAAEHYIFEYIPNRYSLTDENLKNSSAIEIKIGQGTKPGMGGHLPGSKVTADIAATRSKPIGEDIQSPSRFPGIDTPEDLKALVAELRSRSEGRPVGIKLAAGHIESDLAFALKAQPDFITIDGRGGATGSSPKLLRDATSVPTVYALYRARKYLDEHAEGVSLVITGGLRVSSDFAKAIAMGADAVKCPVGIATQDEELRKRLDGDAAAKRVANFLNVSLEELRMFARITGHKKLHDLSTDDLVTISSEIAGHTNIRHA